MGVAPFCVVDAAEISVMAVGIATWLLRYSPAILWTGCRVGRGGRTNLLLALSDNLLTLSNKCCSIVNERKPQLKRYLVCSVTGTGGWGGTASGWGGS